MKNLETESQSVAEDHSQDQQDKKHDDEEAAALLKKIKSDPEIQREFASRVRVEKSPKERSDEIREEYSLNLDGTYRGEPVSLCVFSEDKAWLEIAEFVERKKREEVEKKTVPGLKNILQGNEWRGESGSSQVTAKDVKGDACAFIVEKHSWGPTGGIRKDIMLKVFRNGREYSIGDFKARDQYDATEDNRSRFYVKIEIIEIDEKKVKVRATNFEDGSDEFEITTG